MKTAPRSTWQNIAMPARLLYLLIWQPWQAVNVPFAPLVPLLLLCSAPLAIGLAYDGSPINWLVLVLAWAIAASFALAGMAKEGCALLLIAGVVILARPQRLLAGISETFHLPGGGQLLAALLVCGVLLACSVGVGALLGRLPWRWLAHLWASCAGVLIALLAIIIADVDNTLAAFALLLFAVALLPLMFGAVDGVLFCFALLGFVFAVVGAITVESRVLVPFAGLAGFLFAFLLRPVLLALSEWSIGRAPREATLGVVRRATAPLIAVLLIVAAVLGGVLVAGISVLPAPLFLLVCWFVGLVGLGPYETDWKNVLLVLLVPITGVETQGLAITGLGMVFALVGGYRLLEYALFAPISAWGRRAPAEHADRWLCCLPPWWSEHNWLPLPGHAALLRTALESHSSTAFQAVERMGNLGQPGLDRTLLAALPPFIRAQLLQAQTPHEIAAVAKNPISLVIHVFLQAAGRQGIAYYSNEPVIRVRLRPAAELPWERRRRRKSPLAGDVAVVLPGLRGIAQTVAEALVPPVDARTLAISRARFDLGFTPNEASIEEYIKDVPPQPTLGDALVALDQLAATVAADAHTLARWQPVIAQWHAVLKSSL